MDYSPPDSSVPGISQARILEWVAIFFSKDFPDPGIKVASPASPSLACRFFTTEPSMFDWENAIALQAMQGNRASSRGEGKSHGFCRVAAGTWGTFSSYDGGAHSKREFV